MTITIYPERYMQDKMHDWDKKTNPERHWLTKNSYSREEMQEMCLFCSEFYKWNEKMIYSHEYARYYKKGKRA